MAVWEGMGFVSIITTLAGALIVSNHVQDAQQCQLSHVSQVA